jgi:hypothetical protein
MTVLPLGSHVSGHQRPAVWRAAAIVALVAGLLALVAGLAITYVHTVSSPLAPVHVLKATRNIAAGSVIARDELGTVSVATTNAATLATLVREQDEASIVGRIATAAVPAGYMIPAYIASADSTAALWVVNLPVKHMPTQLVTGDHVALLTTVPGKGSDTIDLVVVQDVQVAAVQGGSADLMLPPTLVAQTQWYAEHGGISLIRMPAGAVVRQLPPGGPPGG